MNDIPPGYHPAMVTAITVFLAFSLAFIRFWSFEADGTWWWGAIISEVMLILSIALQIFSLARALNLKYANATDYGKTVKWFLTAITLLIVALVFSAVIYSETFHR